MIAPWVKNYIGIPFHKNGRDKSIGLDCWGLVQTVLREQYQIVIPDFTYDDASGFSDLPLLIETQKGLIANEQVINPMPGDIVLMRFHNVLSHTGVYAGDNSVLHIERKKNAILEKLSSIRLRNRVEGVYRVL